MAHEIDTTTGKAACMTVGQPAWHGLGVTVEEAQTSDEAIKLAGLDWEVEKRQVYFNANDELVEVPDQFVTVRTDTNAVLGQVGKQYRVFQNRDAFDFMEGLVGDQLKLAMYHTAGSLFGGRRIWMLAKIPKELRIPGTDDVTEPYVLLANSHDGTRALQMIPTSVRVVCNNTLTYAVREAKKAGVAGFTCHHYKSLEARVADAREKLRIVYQELTGIEARRMDELWHRGHAWSIGTSHTHTGARRAVPSASSSAVGPPISQGRGLRWVW